jgi:hypothetical protein
LLKEDRNRCPRRGKPRATLIEPNKGDKRDVRRKADGTFGKTVDMGKLLSADRKRTAKRKVPKGQDERGGRMTWLAERVSQLGTSTAVLDSANCTELLIREARIALDTGSSVAA